MVNSSVRVYPPVFLLCEYRRFFAYLIFTASLLTLTVRNTTGQDNTLYLMPDIPQANQLNPAIMKLCRIYVELPVISSVKVNIRNTAFGFHDVLHTGTGSQSNVYFLNLSNLDSKLKAINYFQTETDVDLLGFGFGYKNWYYTFGISNHTDLLLSYPHDAILLRDVNSQQLSSKGTPVMLNQLGTEVTLWNSIGVSAAKEIRDGFKVGLRLKYLQGMANMILTRSALILNTANNPASLEVLMNYILNSSFPVKVQYSPNGLVNNLNFDNSLNNIAGDFIFNGNRGTAVDAGFVYDIDENTEISGSITDLGFIRWKKNTNVFSKTGDYLYNSSDLAQFQANPGEFDLIKALRDSIFMASAVAGKSYFTLTPVKIFGGISRLILPDLRAGAMTRIEMYNLNIMPSLSFSLNYTPFPSVAASLSYTLMNNKFNQVGAGIAVGNHVGQLYLITDNIPLRFTKDINSPLFWPYNARMFSLRFGFNLLFGCNKKENKFHPKDRWDLCPAYW
ncbi:MAG: DUF5723 family protein [Bacteroidales bacterium]